MTKQESKMIELKKIRLDGDTQPRKEVHEHHVANITEMLLNGGKVKEDPTVFFDGKSYWLADGCHRFHAHKRAGYTEMRCNVILGTKRDAWIHSRGVNGDHGMPRTSEELRATIASCLNDVELCEKSDKQIAEICKCAPMTVGRVRKALELDRPSKVVTKSGKTMETSNIGRKSNVKPTPEPETPEYTADDRISELATEHQHALDEVNKLRDRLAINALPDAAEAKAELEETLDTLRAQVKQLELELRAVTQSRNDYQQKNSDLIKQVTYWKRRAEKAEKAAA